jgi:hypothetical protein
MAARRFMTVAVEAQKEVEVVGRMGVFFFGWQ